MSWFVATDWVAGEVGVVAVSSVAAPASSDSATPTAGVGVLVPAVRAVAAPLAVRARVEVFRDDADRGESVADPDSADVVLDDEAPPVVAEDDELSVDEADDVDPAPESADELDPADDPVSSASATP